MALKLHYFVIYKKAIFHVCRKDKIKKWKEAKGAKKKIVTRKDGGTFNYSEGKLPFPDNLDSPARTIITSEGGESASRTKHIILDPWKKLYRRLTPNEVEKILTIFAPYPFLPPTVLFSPFL